MDNPARYFFIYALYNKMNIGETIKQRQEEELLKEEEMYDKAASYRAGIDNRRFLKKREKLKSRELKNQQTISEQRGEISENPFFRMASKVHETRRTTPTKPKSMGKKDTPENVLPRMDYDSAANVADVLSRVESFRGTPGLIKGQEPLTNKQQNTRSLRNLVTRQNLLEESRKYRTGKGTKKKKRKKRKKPQTPRGRRRRRPPTPRRRRPLTPRRRRRRASRKK